MNSNSTSALTNQYRCIDARTGTGKMQSATVHVLILELHCLDDKAKAIKFFQCELSKNKKNHSAARNGDFAKLYRITFGTEPGHRLSKAQQLIRHFVDLPFYCETELATDKKTGERYQKVTDIRPVEIQKRDLWTDNGFKLMKPKNRQKALIYSAQLTGTELAPNCQNPLAPVLAPSWHELGTNLAPSWHELGTAKTLQPAKTIGLQPFSIPYTNSLTRNKTINTQEGNEEKNAKLSATADVPKTTIIHQPMAGETDEDFQDRFLTESVAQLLAEVSIRNIPLKSETSRI